MTTLLVLEGVALVLLGVLVVGLLRSHAEILRRLHDLGIDLDPSTPAAPVAESAPLSAPEGPEAVDVIGITPAGHAAAVGVVGATHDTVLAFLTSGCLTCAHFWETFGHPDRLGLPARTRLLVVTKGPDGESPTALARVAPPDLTVVMSSAAWDGYAVPGSPYFVLVDGPHGRVRAQGTADRWDDVRARLGLGAPARHQAPRLDTRDPDRRERADSELLAAGIGPGHPTLYAETSPQLPRPDREEP